MLRVTIGNPFAALLDLAPGRDKVSGVRPEREAEVVRRLTTSRAATTEVQP
jgi:hypothetical protein